MEQPAFTITHFTNAMQTGAMQIDHLALHVRDLEKSAEFYEKILGLKKVPEPFHDNLHVWFRVSGQETLHLIGGATNVNEHSIVVHFAFRSAALDEFVALLDDAGVAHRNYVGDGKINTRPDGIRQIYLQDPDGYWIEVNDDHA